MTFDLDAIPVDVGAPAPHRILHGDPRHRTWNVEDTGAGVYAGVWESTPGEWRIDYDEWEFCHILEGISVLTEDGGEAVTLTAGDSFVIRPGYQGRWKVVETTVKHYVIKV